MKIVTLVENSCGNENCIPAFELMKEIMGDKLIALHSGETVI